MKEQHRLARILDQRNIDLYRSAKPAIYITVDPNCPVYAYISGLRKKSSQNTARAVLQSIARHLEQQSIYDIKWTKFDLNTMNQLVRVLEAAGFDGKRWEWRRGSS